MLRRHCRLAIVSPPKAGRSAQFTSGQVIQGIFQNEMGRFSRPISFAVSRGSKRKLRLEIEPTVRRRSAKEPAAARNRVEVPEFWRTQARDRRSKVHVVEQIARVDAQGEVIAAIGRASTHSHHAATHSAKATGAKATLPTSRATVHVAAATATRSPPATLIGGAPALRAEADRLAQAHVDGEIIGSSCKVERNGGGARNQI